MAPQTQDSITTHPPQASDHLALGDTDLKGSTDHLEKSDGEGGGLASQHLHLQAEAEWVRSLTEEEYQREHRKLVRKIDTRLLPTLFILL